MFRKSKIFSLFFISLLFISTSVFASVPLKGDPAPDFTLQSVTGEEISLSSFKGSIVVLGLFHICVPCMNQAIEMQKLIDRGTKDVIVLGVNTSGDSREDIIKYLSSFPTRITFPYLVDPTQMVNRLYAQRFMPTVIIIDQDGIIQYRSSTTSAKRLLIEIRKILNP